ncbi:MAG: lysophospholipid acyltransferase family protein [Candidatus Nitrospinota bacterium M3_3B_026]
MNTYVAPFLAAAFIYAISKTLKIHEVGKETEKKLTERGETIIYVFWHGRLFFCPHYYRIRGLRPAADYQILASPSADGEVVARTLKLFGYSVVRGSSYKSARKSLMELKRAVERGLPAALIGDGSRGPIYKLQPGSLMLSKLTGCPVLPFTMSFSSYWTLKSWDRMMIPKPFSKAVVIYGEPVRVRRDADSAALEKTRAELEAAMRSMTERADSYFEKETP